jgi:tRNA-specific 2-thiouridylase
MSAKVRAIGLVSGGLDSALAVAVMKRAGVEVIGLHVVIGFSPRLMRREVEGETLEHILADESRRLSQALGVPVAVLDRSREYLPVLLRPKHGYGANVNPCIDCHLFMLGQAREVMERDGASFVFTGEVLGQRPMSQNLRALELIDRESGYSGLLVRPLSARLLPRTIAEEKGWIGEGGLLDIEGRSRRRQMELAAELGVTDYSAPAGGCMLTDESYGRRLRDWMRHRGSGELTHEETLLLSVGRHFRLSPSVTIVVGRREIENLYLERAWRTSWLLSPLDTPGATVLVQGEPGEEDLRLAASFAARYSDGKGLPAVRIVARRGEIETVFDAEPVAEDRIERCRV